MEGRGQLEDFLTRQWQLWRRVWQFHHWWKMGAAMCAVASCCNARASENAGVEYLALHAVTVRAVPREDHRRLTTILHPGRRSRSPHVASTSSATTSCRTRPGLGRESFERRHEMWPYRFRDSSCTHTEILEICICNRDSQNLMFGKFLDNGAFSDPHQPALRLEISKSVYWASNISMRQSSRVLGPAGT